MTSICLYMHVHQPPLLNNYSVFDIGNKDDYFNKSAYKEKLKSVVEKSYIPTTKKLLEIISEHEGKFKFALGISGVLIEALKEDFPEVLELFKELVNTGCVELLGETYYHSLGSFVSPEEFSEQVEMHRSLVQEIFKKRPMVFVNTCGLYSNRIAKEISDSGYRAAVAEGTANVLKWLPPTKIYKSNDNSIKLLIRHKMLSDDISKRFSAKEWKEWPLTADKYASWLSETQGDCINLFINYETFGDKQWAESGIFNFLAYFPKEVFNHPELKFKLPSEMLSETEATEIINSPDAVSWLSEKNAKDAWLDNKMQKHVFKELKKMETNIKTKSDSSLLEKWRKLMASDYLYFMSTNERVVPQDVSPYHSPYDAFINMANIIEDLKSRLK